MNVQQVVPFLHVSDMDRSLRFYIDGLGFAITHRWIDEGKLRWCWLQLGGSALMLQEFVPRGKVGEGVALYFICEDAIAIHRELVARGVAASQPTVGNHMWVTSVTDPDGYQLHFESPE